MLVRELREALSDLGEDTEIEVAVDVTDVSGVTFFSGKIDFMDDEVVVTSEELVKYLREVARNRERVVLCDIALELLERTSGITESEVKAAHGHVNPAECIERMRRR